jgi:hypothetical protein
MNKKIILISMLILMISMFSVGTYSFFSDRDNAGDIVFTIGTNEVMIVENTVIDLSYKRTEDSDSESDFENWKPGVDNAVSVAWKLTNSGDQDSNYKVEIIGKWENEEDNKVNWIQTGDKLWEEDDDKSSIYRYPYSVSPGDEIDLSFDVWCESIRGVEDTVYSINLIVESSQIH